MARRRLLVVSHRPLDSGGGGTARWRYLTQVLPDLGWDVHEVSPGHRGIGRNETATSSGEQRAARLRAGLTGVVGRAIGPVVRRTLKIQPEALAPSSLWGVTGRRHIEDEVQRLRPDIVLATVPPIAALFAASAVAARTGTPFVVEFRDPWAGNPYYDAGGSLLGRLEAPALARAARIVTVTEGCCARIAAVHPDLAARMRLLPNGFDPDLIRRRSPVPAPDASGRRTVIHAGSLYGDRTAVTLIAAMCRRDLVSRARLVLLGPVDALSRAAAARAADAGLEVSIEAPVSWPDAIERTAAAHVTVVINSPGTGGDLALPGKLFEALALGRPVLALTAPGSETDKLLRSLNAAQGSVDQHAEAQIALVLADLLDHPPPPVSPERLGPWSRRMIAEHYAAELNGLAAP